MKNYLHITLLLLFLGLAYFPALAQQNTVMIHQMYEPQIFNPGMIRQQYSSDTLGGRIGDIGLYHRQQIGVNNLKTSYLYLSRATNSKKENQPLCLGRKFLLGSKRENYHLQSQSNHGCKVGQR